MPTPVTDARNANTETDGEPPLGTSTRTETSDTFWPAGAELRWLESQPMPATLAARAKKSKERLLEAGLCIVKTDYI